MTHSLGHSPHSLSKQLQAVKGRMVHASGDLGNVEPWLLFEACSSDPNEVRERAVGVQHTAQHTGCIRIGLQHHCASAVAEQHAPRSALGSGRVRCGVWRSGSLTSQDLPR